MRKPSLPSLYKRTSPLVQTFARTAFVCLLYPRPLKYWEIPSTTGKPSLRQSPDVLQSSQLFILPSPYLSQRQPVWLIVLISNCVAPWWPSWAYSWPYKTALFSIIKIHNNGNTNDTSLESYDSRACIAVIHFKIKSQQQVQSTSLSGHKYIHNIFHPQRFRYGPGMQNIPSNLVWLHSQRSKVSNPVNSQWRCVHRGR